jgi:hypothetical protein
MNPNSEYYFQVLMEADTLRLSTKQEDTEKLASKIDELDLIWQLLSQEEQNVVLQRQVDWAIENNWFC